LRAVALRHVQKKKGSYFKLPHDMNPENEFINPQLFPKIYSTLFPFGIGGLEDCSHKEPVSLKRHVNHLLNLVNQRFQEHPSFLFIAFNILQRRLPLLHTNLKMKGKKISFAANSFASISPDAIHQVLERVIQGDLNTAYDDSLVPPVHHSLLFIIGAVCCCQHLHIPL
ncbi:hypothetical protein L208DRAFT_1266036, partial [Tricholoma matsutake]